MCIQNRVQVAIGSCDQNPWQWCHVVPGILLVTYIEAYDVKTILGVIL